MQFFVAAIVITLLSQVLGHSYVTSPISRGRQFETETGCRGPACLGPCDQTYANSRTQPLNTQRGDVLTIKWPRNNHAGGFIRFAWAPTSMSDIHSVFDNHVVQINCHEVGGCAPSDPSNPNGGDNNGADGSVNPCTITVPVPLELTDGAWTLQWAWFGGAFALGDYYSCVDYIVAGGPTGYTTPVFIGGDYSFPGQQKCKFFNTDRLHRCVDEPCNNPVYPLMAQQSGAPYNFPPASGSSSGSTLTPSVTSTTTGSTPVVPASSSSSSTSSSTSSTSSSSSSSSSSSTSTSTTTGSVPVIPDSSSTSSTSSDSSNPTPSGSSSSTSSDSSSSSGDDGDDEVTCLGEQDLGNQRCLSSGNQYQTCSPTRDGVAWAVAQSCQVGLSCHVVSPNVYCY